MAAVMNAVWDLAARVAGKPLWQLLVEMDPEELVDTLDLHLPQRRAHPRRGGRDARRVRADPRPSAIADLERTGYPCYTTSAGWLGYSDDKLRRLAARRRSTHGYRHVKLKVGANLDDDVRRCSHRPRGHRLGREPDDRRQPGLGRARRPSSGCSALAEFKPLWIEEPTSPDDVLGHAAIRKAVAPIGVATGEHGMNRVLFKQLFQAEAIDFCQLDAARLGVDQRDRPRLPDGEEVRRPGLPARRRRRALRAGAAPLGLRLRRGVRAPPRTG